MSDCPECGTEVDPSDRYCPNCGHELADHPAGPGRDGTDEGERSGASPDDAEATDDDTAEGQGPSRLNIPANPHELDVFEFSFKYPLANGFKPVAIAALLVLGVFLIIPPIMFAGYQYRVGRSAAIGRSSPPVIEDAWGLLTDGVRLIVAVGIAALAVGLVTLGLALSGLETLAFAWNTLASFCLTALTPVFYGTGSVSGTYVDGRFLRFIGKVKFWIGYAFQIGISFVLYIAFFVISIGLIFTIVGIFALPFFMLGFIVYATLVQAALWGRIYRDAAEEGQVDRVHDPDRLSSSW